VYPTQHTALTALAAVPLRAGSWTLPELSLFLAGGVLIDVDHYLAYAIKTGDWSLPNAYRWHVKRVPPTVHRRPRFHRIPLFVDRHRPFHAVAPIALLFAVGWLLPFRARAGAWASERRLAGLGKLLPLVRALAWGALFHRLCDYALETFQYRPGIPVEPIEPPAELGAHTASEATGPTGATGDSGATRRSNAPSAAGAPAPAPAEPTTARSAR
jgi:hypothetical protein